MEWWEKVIYHILNIFFKLTGGWIFFILVYVVGFYWGGLLIAQFIGQPAADLDPLPIAACIISWPYLQILHFPVGCGSMQYVIDEPQPLFPTILLVILAFLTFFFGEISQKISSARQKTKKVRPEILVAQNQAREIEVKAAQDTAQHLEYERRQAEHKRQLVQSLTPPEKLSQDKANRQISKSYSAKPSPQKRKKVAHRPKSDVPDDEGEV